MTPRDRDTRGDDRQPEDTILQRLAVTVHDHVREHRTGMLADLLFAIGWVTVVSVLFGLLDAPRWATYMTMAAGVVAYFGFVWSLEQARERA